MNCPPEGQKNSTMVKSGSKKKMFCFVGFSERKKKLHTKRSSKTGMFPSFCFKKIESTNKQKQEMKCPLEKQKNSSMMKSWSKKYVILLSDSQRENKSYTKRSSKPSMLLFFCFKKLKAQANKKKEMNCPQEKQKNSTMVKSWSKKYIILP